MENVKWTSSRTLRMDEFNLHVIPLNLGFVATSQQMVTREKSVGAVVILVYILWVNRLSPFRVEGDFFRSQVALHEDYARLISLYLILLQLRQF
jgi:hypothetical protein